MSSKESGRLPKIISKTGISRSGFYAFSPNVEEFDLKDFKIINSHFQRGKQKLGIRQLKMQIFRKDGLIMNEKKIARIKRKYGLITLIRRRSVYRRFGKQLHEHRTFPNILNRNFSPSSPKEVFSTDITQINYGDKKAYIAAVKDLCTKEIVGKAVSSRIDINLSTAAIDDALVKVSASEKQKLVIHSDQGFHFTHFTYRNKLAALGITQSMSRKGNCLDNAPIESFFGHLKDLLDIEKCKDIEEVKREVNNQINYYNNHRPQLGLKKMPPTEYRRHLQILAARAF